MRVVILVHIVDFALRVEFLEESLLLSLAITDIKGVPCILFVIEDLHLVWQLVIVGTLDIALSSLVRDAACDSISVCLHHLLAGARLSGGC